LHRRLGEPRAVLDEVERVKIVASGYTNWAIPAQMTD
jgi:hypothetical protein